MFIQLESNDRKQLIDLLLNVPDLETPRGCKQILNEANLETFIYRIDFSGSTRIVIGDLINILSKQGRINSSETALGKFLITVKEYTGEEQQAFLNKLLEKYEMIILSIPSNEISTGQSTQRQKILILAAIPQPHNLRLDKEIREIGDAIRGAGRRDIFEICTKTAVRHRDIRLAIQEESPQIVHFCGHGMEDGSLLLEDDAGNHKPVSPQGLASLFELHTNNVKCVLINACYSAKTAEAISQHINYVIGMNQPIEDNAAIAFAQGFYDGLGYRNNNIDAIPRAFKEGLSAIKMENLSQGEIPVLKTLQ